MEAVGDIVVGMRDGLTVPLLLTAELSSTAASGHVVLITEMAAGSIARGLGGELAARSEHESYGPGLRSAGRGDRLLKLFQRLHAV